MTNTKDYAVAYVRWSVMVSLIFTRRQCYALPERLDLIKGYVMGHRDGFGFVASRRQQCQKTTIYYCLHHQMRGVIHGDYILSSSGRCR